MPFYLYVKYSHFIVLFFKFGFIYDLFILILCFLYIYFLIHCYSNVFIPQVRSRF